jgi:hypothetical protein
MKYDASLKEFLNKYEDNHEIYFIEHELEFYKKCHHSSIIKKETIDTIRSEHLVVEIYNKLNDLVSENGGFNFELSNEFQATFKRIVNFLEAKYDIVKAKINEQTNADVNGDATNEIIESTSEKDLCENPYPRIFKSAEAYEIFKRLLVEFGNTKENLSNYSYVFHKMTFENLIYCDIPQTSYFNFLADFDISIDRIKPRNEIGKIHYRESIYSKAK